LAQLYRAVVGAQQRQPLARREAIADPPRRRLAEEQHLVAVGAPGELELGTGAEREGAAPAPLADLVAATQPLARVVLDEVVAVGERLAPARRGRRQQPAGEEQRERRGVSS